MAPARPARRCPDPPEPGHDHRHRDAEGAAEAPVRRHPPGRGRGKLCRHPDAGRHLPDRRPDRALRRPARNDGRGLEDPRPRPQGRRLQRHQIRDLHPPHRPYPADLPTGPLARPARPYRLVAGQAARGLAPA